jgi:hypothetical protein
MNGQRIRQSRAKRILEVVAPMVAEGATLAQICKATGVSNRQACLDRQLVREQYQRQFEDDFDAIRGELAATHRHLLGLALKEYHQGAGTKALETASKQLDALARLHGIAGGIGGLNVNLSNNMTITAEAVADLFRPLDADSYGALVASRSLPAAESNESLSNTAIPCPVDIAAENADDPGPKPTAAEGIWEPPSDTQAGVPVGTTITPTPTERKPRNRRIRHPNQ